MDIEAKGQAVRFPVHRLFAPIVACALAFVIAGGHAAHAAPQASIVMDLRDGRVLKSRSADRKLHPASLTKMMTLYLTFEAVKAGRLKLDQRVLVSRHAARQPASKLYLKAGRRVTVRSLIRATAIKSANDAAMVLAEAVGGSQSKFAAMMTRKAKQLGMSNTRFKNPHGLTQRGHYSTARDMAVLGRHLFFDFPQYYGLFKRRSDVAAGKRIWNTNRLLSTYEGADGIKTGYTRAAGYNLVATARRGQKRIIAVQFGAKSSRDRARKVAALLDAGFARANTRVARLRPSKKTAKPAAVAARKPTRATKPRGSVARAPTPAARPGMETSVANALAEVLAPRAAAAVPDQPVITNRSALAPRSATRPRRRPTTVQSVDDAVAKVLAQQPVRAPGTTQTPAPSTQAARTTRQAASPAARPVPRPAGVLSVDDAVAQVLAEATTATAPRISAAPRTGPLPRRRPVKLAQQILLVWEKGPKGQTKPQS